MFCSQCGTENQTTSHFCKNCGVALADTPGQGGSASQSQAADSAIWNPNAAANWSLIFSPAFGSYLQMLNWRALGESENAANSQNWFYASLVMLAVYVFLGLVTSENSKAAEGSARLLGLVFLLVWYFTSGREQVKYVNKKLGTSYIRKPWGKALLFGFGAMVVYVVAAVIVGVIFGIASAMH